MRWIKKTIKITAFRKDRGSDNVLNSECDDNKLAIVEVVEKPSIVTTAEEVDEKEDAVKEAASASASAASAVDKTATADAAGDAAATAGAENADDSKLDDLEPEKKTDEEDVDVDVDVDGRWREWASTRFQENV